MTIQKRLHYFDQLETVAEEVIDLLSATMDVNTVFMASNDQYSNFILKAFNRKNKLLQEGDVMPFEQVLCKLVTDKPDEPIVITDLAENPLTTSHFVTEKYGTGCFIGAPIYKNEDEIFGTICAFDTKPHEFTSYDVKLIKTLSTLLSQTIMLEDLSVKDHLTGLYNTYFIKQLFKTENLNDQNHALVYIDLDNFKQVNDDHGHDMGDELLASVAKNLKQMAGEESITARIGGDEFVMLVPVTTKECEEAKTIAEQILHTFRTIPLLIQNETFHISASIGITFVDPSKSLKDLVREADQAMYSAKRSGPGQIITHAVL